MLDQGIKDALQEYAKKVSRNVVFKLNPGEHEKRAELVDMLETVAGMSDLITLEHGEVSQSLASGVTFEVLSAGNAEGVIFSGVPGGHEFSSFVLAFLQVGGVALKLDESVQKLVAAMNQPLKFQTVISLSCHNCPDVVQTLNQFAMLNPNITHEMIDGGLYPEFVEKHKVQGVPSVILNDEPFANGKVEPASLIAKLQEYTTKNAPADAEPVTTQITLEDLLANLQDVLVVGGGPAGVSSAIYAARKGLKVTLVAERFGGQVKDTVGIENLISVPHTTGTELTAHLRQHVESYSVAIKEHFKVTRVAKLQDEFSDVPADIKSDIHLVYLSSGEVIASKTMIIATGAKWRELGVPGEKENIGSGVAYCPHCDGPFFKGKKVAVIGGGNSGVEAALDLAGIVDHVTVFEFMPELKADKVLIEQMDKRDNINVIKNVATKQVIADNGKVVAIEYQHRDTDVIEQLELSGIFVQIGLLPNTSFLDGYVETNRFGEVVIDAHCATNRPGVFAAGDSTTVPYKQIIISMGEGAKASLSAFDYLIKNF
ncbi:MAG: alkyl hydroperoxide reductase subunit F [Gammaproteobacteria bacterium]|nr:alkyl hydroperoxide reductase subunit F [Gammaproteobacteria bacterium]HBF09222.1 alkyl hydroperoxide reductase subunit F [Gammaproteobacteria bacterium]|tara:strand:- start:21010 stop:22635 length:1626 start_codon:yes stop_codon:yes gene_type:complete